MAQKILVVEDDSYIRELYGEALGNAGYQVESAGDGISGLEKIQLFKKMARSYF